MALETHKCPINPPHVPLSQVTLFWILWADIVFFFKQITIKHKVSILESMSIREKLRRKFRVIIIQILIILKTKHLSIKNRNQDILSRECICHNTIFTFLLLDHIENLFKKLNPIDTSLI